MCNHAIISLFIQQLLFGGWTSANLSISWKVVECKLFMLNVVSPSTAVVDCLLYQFLMIVLPPWSILLTSTCLFQFLMNLNCDKL